MDIVADVYSFVVGVDTHARHHSYAVIECHTGRLLDAQNFPTSNAGLDRAVEWIGHRTCGDLGHTLVSVEGTGSYGAVLTGRLSAAGYRVVEAPTPDRKRSTGKTDATDALAAARQARSERLDQLRDIRARGDRAALQTLTSLRDMLNSQRLALINALTALLRAHDLSIDARKALTPTQIDTIATWRTRPTDDTHTAVIRATCIRHARAIRGLETELADNKTLITAIVKATAPELLDLHGVGPITAAVILTVWSHPGRIHTDAAFAKIAGACPIPAQSGNNQTRHRLNRGGDRRLNRAIHTIVLTRWRTHPDTHTYITRRRAQGKTDRDIRRCLRRYIAREIWRTLNQTPT
ncbi:MAG: IS110 family transposase [Microbacterium sp.]